MGTHRPISEKDRIQSTFRPQAGNHDGNSANRDRLQYWRRSLGTAIDLAAGVREGMSFAADAGAARRDSYVSDPAKPVPCFPRLVNFEEAWVPWLTHDHRSVVSRPDVMTFQPELLKQPVRASCRKKDSASRPSRFNNPF